MPCEAERSLGHERHRVRLVFTGHLRDTCEVARGIAAVQDQAVSCRRVFNGAGDVFIHTWDRLGKSSANGWLLVQDSAAIAVLRERRLYNTSSQACLLNISAAMRPVARSETQPPDN